MTFDEAYQVYWLAWKNKDLPPRIREECRKMAFLDLLDSLEPLSYSKLLLLVPENAREGIGAMLRHQSTQGRFELQAGIAAVLDHARIPHEPINFRYHGLMHQFRMYFERARNNFK